MVCVCVGTSVGVCECWCGEKLLVVGELRDGTAGYDAEGVSAGHTSPCGLCHAPPLSGSLVSFRCVLLLGRLLVTASLRVSGGCGPCDRSCDRDRITPFNYKKISYFFQFFFFFFFFIIAYHRIKIFFR